MNKNIIPEEYADFLETIKGRITITRYQAVRSLNKELLLLYHRIGTDIIKRQEQYGWGAKVIDKLSQDLGAAFPEMKGFSTRNLKYMRLFAEIYPEDEFVQQLAAQMNNYQKPEQIFSYILDFSVRSLSYQEITCINLLISYQLLLNPNLIYFVFVISHFQVPNRNLLTRN